jgi:predicted Fe-Mo cluster-binding NifX family protein
MVVACCFQKKEANENMKMALTVWKNRISPVFDAANMLLVAEIENTKIISRRYESFEPGLSSGLADRLTGLNIEVLICGAISKLPANIIEVLGIRLIPFITGRADEVLDVYAKGISIIPTFLMPGCGHKRGRRAGKREKHSADFIQKKEVIYMPRGDGTGPQGQGTGTGKGQGGCNSGKGERGSGRNSGQGIGSGGQGRGQGRGKGGGQGRGKGGGKGRN